MHTLGLTLRGGPASIDEAVFKYHQFLVLPRFHKQFQLNEYLETFMSDLLQRLREAEVLRDDHPTTMVKGLVTRMGLNNYRIEILNDEVVRLNANLEALREAFKADVERRRVPQQPRPQHLSVEEQVRAAQYAAYRTRGSPRRAPSRDGSCRSGTEDNGLPVNPEELHDAVCRSLQEGRARGSHWASSDAGDSNAVSTPSGVDCWYPSGSEPAR